MHSSNFLESVLFHERQKLREFTATKVRIEIGNFRLHILKAMQQARGSFEHQQLRALSIKDQRGICSQLDGLCSYQKWSRVVDSQVCRG